MVAPATIEGFWSGEKTIVGGANKPPVEIMRVGPFPVAEVVTVEVESDPPVDVNTGGTRKTQFWVDVGVGRSTSRVYVGGATLTGAFIGEPLHRGQVQAVAQSVTIHAIPDGTAAPYVVRARVARGGMDGRFQREQQPFSSIISSVAQNAASVVLVPGETAFEEHVVGVWIYNDAGSDLYLKMGITASLASFSVRVPANTLWECPFPAYRGRIDGIWAAAGGGFARITELRTGGAL